MRQLTGVGVTAALIAFANVASAQFADCPSAKGAGLNTTISLVSSVFNRIGCDASADEVAAAQAALASAISALALDTSMADELKTCFYEGLYEGYVTTLVSEYEECSAVPSGTTLGVAGAAVFIPLFRTVPEVVDEQVLERVFAAAVTSRTEDSRAQCRVAFADATSVAFPRERRAARLGGQAALLVCGSDE